jgi:two-component system nitrogen regulation sensor histidine kinase NtrY
MEVRRSRFSLAGKLAFVVALDVAAVAGVAAVAAAYGFPPLSIFLAALGAGLPLAFWTLAIAWKPIRATLTALADGVGSFQENDFSLRLAVDREDELGDLVALYNRVGDALRVGRNDIYQRELLLDTLLQGAPMAILLVNQLDRIVYANFSARHLLGGGRRLQGHPFSEVIAAAPEGAREPLASGRDAVFTWGAAAPALEGAAAETEEETYRVLHRRFQLHTQENRLVVIERITPELRRQEVEVWKKAIRVLSHELNNSLAPVSSLLHSARHVAGKPEESERLAGIFDAIDERVRHLSDFLDGYGRFARLPRPVKVSVPWGDLLDPVGRLFPFRRLGELPSEPAVVDPAQMQQVLINLVKNAAESGSPAEEIAISVDEAPGAGAWRLRVLDRGSGMDDETMKRALLPFYSSKPTGSGLGLALCSEIVQAHGGTLRLERRAGGGIAVTCVLPSA